MSGITLERRRLLGSTSGGGTVEAPPTPVVYVYPSKGNTLTISNSSSGSDMSDSRESSGRASVTVTNTSYNSWTNPNTSVLVNMTNYDKIYSTKSGTANTNMVWCYTYCPDTVGATINAKITYILSSGSAISTSVENLSVTTTSSGFISLSINNSFAGMSGGTSPNYGHPYLDKTNVTSIRVELSATKNGATSISKSFSIYIQNTSVTLSAPTFSPAGGTYGTPQTVSIVGDPNYSSQIGFSTHWCTSQSPTTPTTSNSYTPTAQIGTTCYLNAKSFLDLGNGTTVESAVTSQLYTINTPSETLLPPTFNPGGGTYSGSTNVYIDNPNSSPTATYEIRYTDDGTTPTENSVRYSSGHPIPVYSTTTLKAIVVNTAASPHTISPVATATYNIDSQYTINYVNALVNTDTPSTCGDYVVSKSQNSGTPSSCYGFSINASNKSSQVYFTTDGSDPTTQSQSITSGSWYYLLKPNTTLVKYLVVAPSCVDVTGSFWILINKAMVVYQYNGLPLFLGPIGNLNWYSDSQNNYNEDSSCYIYFSGERIDPSNNPRVSVHTVDITIDGSTEQFSFLKYTPASGTSIDSTLRFVYGYSSPEKYWDGRMCPYSPFYVMNGVNGTGTELLTAARTIMSSASYPTTIYFSSNEMYTLCCAYMVGLYNVNFGGRSNSVSACDKKMSLDYGAFTATSIEYLDLTPCTSMVSIEDRAMAATTYNGQTTVTSLKNVLMPFMVSSLGKLIFSKYNSSQTFTPLTVTFYNPSVPSASYNTFRELNESSGLIDNNSTVVVSSTPYMAVVCDYENAWHYHTPRAGTGTGSTTNQNKTNMKIVDENGLQCGEYPPGSLPTVTTGTPGSIAQSSATISGNSITNTGGYTITQKGVCWSTSHSPMYSDHHLNNTGTSNTWNASISGLEPSTKYYVRAFARNEAGIGYGDEKSFTTSAQLSVPILSKGHIYGDTPDHQFNFVTNEMRIGTKVVSNGGAAITERKLFMKFSSTPLSQSEYPSPTNYTHSVSQAHTWTESNTEFFDFLVDLDNLSGIPQSGYAYFIVHARNSVGWSYRYNVNSIQYSLSTVVYPTITLSNPIHIEGQVESPQVYANANVTCGTYGYILVQTYISSANNAEPGDSTVIGPIGELWRYSDGSGTHTTQTINSDGNYTVYVMSDDLQQLAASTVYYLRSRVRQSQNSHWVYSNSVPFMKWNEQITGFNTVGSSNVTFNTANLSAAGTVYPAKPYYGIMYEKVSDQNFHYAQQFYMDGSSATNKNLTITAGNLSPNTQYVFRSFVSPNSQLNTWEMDFGVPMNFTTSALPDTPYYLVNSGSGVSSKRVPAPLNLSFEREWHSLGHTYCWGGYGGLWAPTHDNHFHNSWEYIGNAYGNNDGAANHKRDLFGWGTSCQSHRDDDYNAWSTDTTNTYSAYDNGSYSLTQSGQNGMANWAWQKQRSGNQGIFTAIDVVFYGCGVLDPTEDWYLGHNGGDTWRGDVKYCDISRPLTNTEMQYVLFDRITTSRIRYCKGRIDHGNGTYTNGLIILSEGWRSSYHTLNQTNSTSAPYTSNTITESTWNSKLKVNNRAIFLPAAGYRNNKTVSGVNSEGWYWLNNSKDSNNAYCLKFTNSTLEVTYKQKYMGLSVRLWEVRR